MLIDDLDDDGYFSEVDDGDDTGLAPKFYRLPDLERPTSDLNDLPIDELIKMYIGLRNQLSTDRKGYKARESRVKSLMMTVASVLLTKAISLGVTSFNSAAGSGYRKRNERFKVATDGWTSLCDWVKSTNNFHVFQRRVTAEAVREIRDAEGLPPGISQESEETFVIRSPKK